MKAKSHIDFEFNCDQQSSAFKHLNGELFCGACQTTVYDFSKKSTEEIVDMLKQKGGRLCGQFFTDQVAETEPAERPLRLNVLLMSVTAFLTFSAPKISAQSQSPKTEQGDSIRAKPVIAETQDAVHDTSVCRETIEQTVPFWLTGREGVKRHEYMRIGRRHFYIISKFPFFRTRKMRRGRVAYRGPGF